MPNASQEFELSIFATKEAIEQYQEWLKEVLKTDQVEIIEAPQYADFDYYVYVNGLLHHLLEVKTRRHEGGRYDQEKMPLRKHAVAAFFMREQKLKTIYLCSWIDKIAILELHEMPNQISTMVARYDRGNEQDIYAMYDFSRFKLIKNRKRPEPPKYRLFQGRYIQE